jgi:hypothetical protein
VDDVGGVVGDEEPAAAASDSQRRGGSSYGVPAQDAPSRVKLRDAARAVLGDARAFGMVSGAI